VFSGPAGESRILVGPRIGRFPTPLHVKEHAPATPCGSLWPVVLHAAHNTFIQQFVDPRTADNSKTGHVAWQANFAPLCS
jgi:hypothetical protein